MSSNNLSQTKPFRDAQRVGDLVDQINQLAGKVARNLGHPVQVMEVCGGHTHAIYQSGIDQLINDNIEFIHGPGCPVCVLPMEAIDQAVELAQKEHMILASFGDPLRVPGSKLSLQQAKALGADVRILYSPFDALNLAQDNPESRVVFFAIGFDTTMPSIAQTIITAQKQGITNLFFLCHHIRLMPTLYALLERGEIRLDGFIGPGHVSMVTGSRAYQSIAQQYHKPLVIAGFEPVDFLQALLQLLLQLNEGRCEIENAYSRVVTESGNPQAQLAIASVFEEGVDSIWHGLGKVANSGIKLSESYKPFDASQFLTMSTEKPTGGPANCENTFCGQVLRGARKPNQCPMFKTQCNPENPLGALMVSSEGACAAYYKYHNEIESEQSIAIKELTDA